MARNAFTDGIKPGGLTTSGEIRLLLCYLVRTAAPLTRQNIEDALLGEQLVNYFELAACLAELETENFVTVDEAGIYHITSKGASVTDELSIDMLPRTVREAAANAAIRAGQWTRKSAQHQSVIEKAPDGFVVRCWIEERGNEVFGMRFSLPDRLTAETIQKAFVEKGDVLYALMLETMAGSGN